MTNGFGSGDRRPRRAKARDILTHGSAHILTLTRCAILVATASFLAACESFRIHDPGRLEAAQQAVDLSSELSSTAGSAFVPMEENLDGVADIQAELRGLTNEHEFETFKVVLPELTAPELSEMVVEAVEGRNRTMDMIVRMEGAAVAAVNAALDRQASVTKILEDKLADQKNLEDTLKRVQERIEWIDDRLDSVIELHGEAHALRKGGDVGNAVSEGINELSSEVLKNEEAIRKVLAGATSALEDVRNDERVGLATKLLREAGQEVTANEQSRLVEIRRHLEEIRRIRRTLDVRDDVSVYELFSLMILPNLYPGLIVFDGDSEEVKERKNEERERLEKTVEALRESNRYLDADGESRIPILTGPDAWEFDEDVQTFWKDGRTLAGFLAADLTENEGEAKSPELVASLGVVLFYEREIFENGELQLAREQHRHSIRLSRINAQQRASLVHQLTQGLQIYFQGGIRPEQVAELLLIASQVGALTYIGTEV